jgi:exopolysaccharide biosynthesis polyprenyl glycosylphosphotransferase
MTRRFLLALSVTRLFGDIVVFGVAIYFGLWARFALPVLALNNNPPQSPALYYTFAVTVIGVGVLLMNPVGTHSMRPSGNLDTLLRAVRASTAAYLVALAISFSLRGLVSPSEGEVQSRVVLAVGWSISIALLYTWRLFLEMGTRWVHGMGIGLQRVAIVGTGDLAHGFFSHVSAMPELGVDPIGLVQTDGEPACFDGEMCLGSIDNVNEVIRSSQIDQILIADQSLSHDQVAKLVVACERADIAISMMPSYEMLFTSTSRIEEIHGFPIITIEQRLFSSHGRLAKRVFDLSMVLGAFVSLGVVIVPLLVLVAIAIKVESPGPVLFRQRRIGKGGRPFDLLKFRSMGVDAEERKKGLMASNEASGPLFKMRNDPRVTRIGGFLRRSSLDELPQLINVLAGDMTLVGPRPPLPEEVDQYADWQMRRFEVVPGIVGLPQVNGRSNLTFDETIRLDLLYIDNWSLLMDLKVLLKAIPTVILGRGAY